MQFLKILFWCLLAFIAAVFTISNWNAVQIQLWGGLIADAKLPILLFLVFLLGLLPTMLIYRAKMWALRRRIEPLERNAAKPVDIPAIPATPAPAPPEEARLATDTKVWPQA